MSQHQPNPEPHTASHTYRRALGRFSRPADSFGVVLLLLLLDYIAVSALTGSEWGRVSIIVLLGATLLFALHTARARRIWQILALVYLLASTLIAVISVAVPGAHDFSKQISNVGGLLLIVTPFAILARISTHRIITTETVLGAICVYLLIGFSFTFIYSAIDVVSAAPFFEGQAHATANAFLFFSYTTLTTVGYGNLIPAGNVGQTFAMLEALIGQIYLVIIVARLVSLWGQERPAPASRGGQGAASGNAELNGGQGSAVMPAATPASEKTQLEGQ